MTAAAAATLAPGPLYGPGTGATASDTPALTLTLTLTLADIAAWETELASAGGCAHPVRLHGSIRAVDLATGEARPMLDTGDLPGGVLLTPCGNRRESACPACSAVYKRDARQLIRAGLAGGKGLPGTISQHPCVFATLTAPGFGPVHSRRMRGKTVLPCRPRRDQNRRRCPHGRDISCPVRHGERDPRLGRALCPDCYDYQAAVLFNALAPELWRRFTTYLPRHLARLAGVTMKELRAAVAVRYVKVAEWQERGVVHYHAVIRLDAPGDEYQPPPARYDAALLCRAITAAAAAVTLATGPDDQHPDIPARTLRFGPQTDCRTVNHRPGLPGTGGLLSAVAVANYIAKYATKSLEAPGLPHRPLRSGAEVAGLRCNAHYKAMMATAWRLGAVGATGDPRLRRWAHCLGYGGHFLTKSRAYSVTFGALRRARADHRKRQKHPGGETDPWGRPLDETVVLVLRQFAYAGTGYACGPGPAELALASAARARDHDQAA